MTLDEATAGLRSLDDGELIALQTRIQFLLRNRADERLSPPGGDVGQPTIQPKEEDHG